MSTTTTPTLQHIITTGLFLLFLGGIILLLLRYLSAPRIRTGPPPPPEVPPEYYNQRAKESAESITSIFAESFKLIKDAHAEAARTISETRKALYTSNVAGTTEDLYTQTKSSLEAIYGTPLPPTAQAILKRIKELK